MLLHARFILIKLFVFNDSFISLTFFIKAASTYTKNWQSIRKNTSYSFFKLKPDTNIIFYIEQKFKLNIFCSYSEKLNTSPVFIFALPNFS